MNKERLNRLKTLLQQSPDDTFLNHAMGVEQAKLGKDEQACRYFERVLEIDAGYVGTYYQLAKCYERLGRVNDALTAYTKGMDAAQRAGDQKTLNEIMMAKEDLEDEY